MSFIDTIKERARKNIKTIVLPEAEDRRVLEAAATTLKEGNAKVVLLGAQADIDKLGEGLDLSGAKVINPKEFDGLQSYIDKLVELRAKKGMTPELAREALTTDYTTFAVMMVKMGDADGVVSGACH
ncbi:MAG: phosphate acetyltransferase, partial [Lachnospiraceae bacterium]|nr:phosphate acetyltransferase [Lachnospiraceae bacterium]